jgi:hypothetical protein
MKNFNTEIFDIKILLRKKTRPLHQFFINASFYIKTNLFYFEFISFTIIFISKYLHIIYFIY